MSRCIAMRPPWNVHGRGSGEGSVVDLDQQHLQGATRAPSQSAAAAHWPAAQARPVLPVYSVDERVRQRNARVLAGRVCLFLLDAAMLNVAFVAAYYLRYVILAGVVFTPTGFVPETLASFRSLEVAVTLGMLLTFSLRGLYRLRSTGTWFKQFWTIAGATTMAFAVFSAYTYVFRSTDFFVSQTRALVAFTWVAVIVVVIVARLLVSSTLSSLYRRAVGLTNLLVFGPARLAILSMPQIPSPPHPHQHAPALLHNLHG